MNYYLTIGLCVLYIFLNILQVVEYEREKSFFVVFFGGEGGWGGGGGGCFCSSKPKEKTRQLQSINL